MADIRDDSAGNYGVWSNPADQSWFDWLKMKAADVQQGGRNLEANLLSALSPYGPEGWQVPPAIHEPVNAVTRLMGTPSHPGTFGQGPDYPGNADDMRTLLLSTYGGNALNPVGMAERSGVREIPAAVLSDTGKPSIPGAIVAGAEKSIPAAKPSRPWFHGSPYEFDNFDLDEVAARRENTNNGFAGISFAPSRREAADYGPYLKRAKVNVSNPFLWNLDDFPSTIERARQIYPAIDKAVRETDFPVMNRWEFAQALRNAGHDALDVKLNGRTNERVVFDPANIIVFSDNTPSIPGSVIAGAEHPQGFDVWHGSPHDFDQFDISKIGTGEGAQVYGHGIYTAEDPNIAKHYQKSVPYQVIKRQFQDALPDDADFPDVTDLLGTGHFTPYQDDVLRALAKDDWLGFDYPSQAISAAYSKNIHNWDPSPDLLKALDNSGYLYQARINADPADFLDWHKSIPEQSQSVRDKIVGREKEIEDAWTTSRMGPQQTEIFKSAGIPGISYLDAGSRAAGQGSRNYVLFSHDPASIIHKWRGDTQLYSDGLPSLLNPALQGQQQQYPNSLFTY